LRMTKVIKGEFEKLEDLKVKDVSLTCDTSLEVFNNEFNRLNEIDDDLFTYEVEVANILCDSNKDDDSEQRMSHEADDDMGYDPSDVSFTEWLGSKKFNYKTIDHYTKKALWIYWIRGDDEVELTNEEFSDNEDEVAEVFRIETNIFDFETPMRWNKIRMDDSILSSNNTTTETFFKPYPITREKGDTKKEDEPSQTKRKDSNTSKSIDKQANKIMCKAENFEAIQYSLRPNE
ncbi:hypothetical protein Tco_1027375, partial [Tanacetum coccineum]